MSEVYLCTTGRRPQFFRRTLAFWIEARLPLTVMTPWVSIRITRYENPMRDDIENDFEHVARVVDEKRKAFSGDEADLIRRFNRERRILARDLGHSATYFLADDDALPLLEIGETPEHWAAKGIDWLKCLSRLAMVCPYPDPEDILASAPPIEPFSSAGGLLTCASVGTLRLCCRSAMLTAGDFPPIAPEQEHGHYDITEGQWLRAKGWDLAYALDWRCYHLGHGEERSEFGKEASWRLP
jgi:hypothetical protein